MMDRSHFKSGTGRIVQLSRGMSNILFNSADMKNSSIDVVALKVLTPMFQDRCRISFLSFPNSRPGSHLSGRRFNA